MRKICPDKSSGDFAMSLCMSTPMSICRLFGTLWKTTCRRYLRAWTDCKRKGDGGTATKQPAKTAARTGFGGVEPLSHIVGKIVVGGLG